MPAPQQAADLARKAPDGLAGGAGIVVPTASTLGVGGHEEEQKGDEQFEISDPRTVDEVDAMLKERGLQPGLHRLLYTMH